METADGKAGGSVQHRPVPSDDVELRQCNKKSRQRDGDQQGPDVALDHDAILKQPYRLILNPYLAREYLSDQRRFAVLVHPQFVPVAVRGAKRVQGDGTFGPVRQGVDVVGGQGGFVVDDAIETGQ